VFIGLLFVVSGFGYLTGVANSAIARVVGTVGVHIWGGVLMCTGILLVVATVLARIALKKLALRVLSCCMLAYTGWVLIIVPISHAATTVVLTGSLVVLAEFEVAHLKALIKHAHEISKELSVHDT